MKTLLVSIVIVNYNTEKEIEKCLNSVLSSQFLPKARLAKGGTVHSLEIIVVDNASTDNSVEKIESLRLKVENLKLIKNRNNLGFAKANNVGVKSASGNFLFFLNPDTQIKKDTIPTLLEFAKEKPNSIIGPKILNADGSIQGSCYNLPTIFGAIREYWLGEKGAYEKFAPKGDNPTKVPAIVGAAMFLTKGIFEKLGGFDERYFLYYEDLDLCRKAARLKIPVYYYPQVVVVHSLGKAGGNIEHLKKSAQIYHGRLKYLLLTLIIKIGLWLKKS